MSKRCSNNPMVILKKRLCFFYTCTKYLSSAYIISAVRTPIGSVEGSLSELSVAQLSALTLKSSLERARIPCENIQTIFLGCSESINRDIEKQLIFLSGFPAAVDVIATKSGIQSVISASQFVTSKMNLVCAAVGVESGSKNLSAEHNFQQDLSRAGLREKNCKEFTKRDFVNFKLAWYNRVFDDEIIEIRKKGQNVTFDDEVLFEEQRTLKEGADGSSALVLADSEYINNNSLSAQAKILSVVTETIDSKISSFSVVNIVKKGLTLAGCNTKDITQWELDNFLIPLCPICIKELNISSSLININGSSLIMGNPIGMTGARIVSHLTHSLNKSELGCAAACNIDGTLSVIVIQKLKPEASGKPRLTLYTKHPCQLCDELKEALHSFKERFIMEEVNIETEDNRKIRSLYKYEIPVLFLDGKFLCKHKIDVGHFSRRLEEAEKDRLK